MSRMNLPGFTAELSLYKTSGLYHAAKVEQTGGRVYPAQFSFFEPLCGYQMCIIDFDPNNRPIWGDCCGVTQSLPDLAYPLSSCWVWDPRSLRLVNRCLYPSG